jgi:hypothetical protein
MSQVQSRTTLSRKKKPNPPASGQSRAAKVFHITDFQDLYELTDDVRKERSGPLRYVKSLVTLSPFSPGAESRHFERMHALQSRAERHLLRSVLEDLKAWVAAKPFGLRGYLVTVEGKPASCEYLAEQLTLDIEDLKQALPILEQIGFLERVPMNGQLEQKPARAQAKTGAARTPKNTPKKSTQRNTRKSKTAKKPTVEGRIEGLPERAGLSRNEPESSCPPSRVGKSKSKSKSKSKAKEKSNRPSASKVKDKDNPRPSASAEEQAQVQTASGAKQSQTTEETPTAPAAAPPMTPTPSENGRASGSVPARPDSVHHADDPGHLSHALNSVRRRCNATAIQAGRDIYRALGSPWPDDSPESAREVGAFASCFERAMGSGIGPTVLVQLWEELTKEAARLRKVYAKNGNGYRSAARVWCKKILPGKLCAMAQQRSPPETAAM